MLHPNSREGLPQISVVIPVRDAASVLPRCLEAVRQSEGVVWECIVVDDCSVDASTQIAWAQGAMVLETGVSGMGPAYARNVGASAAAAPLLCFVDADVVIRPDTLAQFVALFEAEPGLTAAFGSYDAEPEALDLFSQYRNLLHHWVHQRGHEAASTFWAGCGAIRRAAFLAHGGFDPTYSRPSIEDIELGYRLRASGARVRLAKHIQVKHLKRWTLFDIVKTDIRDRALPWTSLILRTRCLPNDLNLDTSGRVSVLSVYALLGLLLLGRWRSVAWFSLLFPLMALLLSNRDLYLFFLRRRGLSFLLGALPLHWLFHTYSAAAFVYGAIDAIARNQLDRRRRTRRPTGSKA